MKISKIVIHGSDSSWGTAAEIDAWHRERAFRWRFGSIGYHYVVGNGRPRARELDPATDGEIWAGRSEDIAGSHVGPIRHEGVQIPGLNSTSLGVCLIGRDLDDFSARQIHITSNLAAAMALVYKLDAADVIGHCETPSGKAQGKTCPVISMGEFRQRVRVATRDGVDPFVAAKYEQLRDRGLRGEPPAWAAGRIV